MDMNNSVVNALNPISGLSQSPLSQNESLERAIAGNQKINGITEDAVRLDIKEAYFIQRSDLAPSLKNLNNGLTITSLAKESLTAQNEFLKDVKRKLNDLTDTKGLSSNQTEDIRKNIIKDLQNFMVIANNTKFDYQTIISQTNNIEDIQISTPNDAFSVKIPKTNEIAQTLAKEISNTAFTPDDIDKITSLLNSNSNKLNNFVNAFDILEQSLQSTAEITIVTQEQYAHTKLPSNVNFAREVTSFSKANILSQDGYLTYSQTNTSQNRTQALLR